MTVIGCAPEDSRSAKQESRAERIARVEAEDVAPRAVGAPLDFGYDGRVPVDRRSVARHPRVEHRVDDRLVAKPLADGDQTALVEDREASRGARSARRPIDFTVGEDRDVALAVLGRFPEDDPVDAGELG